MIFKKNAFVSSFSLYCAQECTPDKLKNVGPGITSFTDIKMNSEITGAVPPFECMKVEARDVHNGELFTNQSID